MAAATKLSITTEEVSIQADTLQNGISLVCDVGLNFTHGGQLLMNAVDYALIRDLVQKQVELSMASARTVERLRVATQKLHNVATAYEEANSQMKKEVEDWVGDTLVMTELEYKIYRLKETDGLSEGSYNSFDFMNWVSYYKGQPVLGAQCCAAARIMQIEVMGGRGYDCGVRSFAGLQVGDVVHYYGGGADATNGHWVLVTEVKDNSIIVSEGNWVAGTITHGREIPNNGKINIVQVDRYTPPPKG